MCLVTCSAPHIYTSTFFRYLSASLLTNASSLFGSMYLIQYRDDHARPGIVLDSRFALVQSGSVTFIRSSISASGHSVVHVGA